MGATKAPAQPKSAGIIRDLAMVLSGVCLFLDPCGLLVQCKIADPQALVGFSAKRPPRHPTISYHHYECGNKHGQNEFKKNELWTLWTVTSNTSVWHLGFAPCGCVCVEGSNLIVLIE